MCRENMAISILVFGFICTYLCQTSALYLEPEASSQISRNLGSSLLLLLPAVGAVTAFNYYTCNELHHHTERRHFESPLFNDCPNGFTRYHNSCFHAAHDLANWPEAVVYCQVYGSHLAFIASAAESQFVTAYLKNFSASATDPDHYYWIGGTDAVSEGSWYWINVVRPIKYVNWGPGQPDNSPAHSSKHQDCLAILESTGMWDDGWCETKHNFLCEIDLDVEPIIG